MFIGSLLLPHNKKRNMLYTHKLSAYYTKSVQLILTTWSIVLPEKLTSPQLVKIFPAFYGTLRFITAITTASQLSLPSARSIQSIPPHPISWRSILILSSHLRRSLSSGLFPSHLPTKTRYASLLSHIRATFLAHLILLHLIIQIIFGEEGSSWSSSLCSLLHSHLPRPY